MQTINEITDEWINRLKSGTYKQTCRRLRTHDNKFCALGVLGDVLSEVGICYWHNIDTSWTLIDAKYTLEVALSIKHPRVRHHTRIPSGVLTMDGNLMGEIISMNDSQELSLPTIGDRLSSMSVATLCSLTR
jgi:hypothetical protein